MHTAFQTTPTQKGVKSREKRHNFKTPTCFSPSITMCCTLRFNEAQRGTDVQQALSWHPGMFFGKDNFREEGPRGHRTANLWERQYRLVRNLFCPFGFSWCPKTVQTGHEGMQKAAVSCVQNCREKKKKKETRPRSLPIILCDYHTWEKNGTKEFLRSLSFMRNRARCIRAHASGHKGTFIAPLMDGRE